MAAVIDTAIQELDADEGAALLDRAARRHLDMTGEEFIQAWDAGKFRDADDSNVMRVAMLLPFGR